MVKDRGLDDNGDVPGESDLIPNNWFDKLGSRVNEANKNAKDQSNKIIFVIPPKKMIKKNKSCRTLPPPLRTDAK